MTMRGSRPSPCRAGGLTLIELLVVVAILSAASVLVFGVFAEDRTQIRYDDTRQRLQTLYRAVLGHAGPSAASDIAMGFVADNGDLPADLATLLNAGTLDARTARSPVFDPKPDDATCENDGSANDIVLAASTPVTPPAVHAPAAQLVKGHRGDYLGGLAVNGRFRDGWGNVSSTDDALNFGWATSHDGPNKSLSITSLGLDNVNGGLDYAADFGQSLVAGDWLIPISGWTVQVRNLRTTDIDPNRLSVSLLVYANRAGGGKWRRHATASLGCMDGTDDNLVGGLPCSRTASIAFIDGCRPGVTVAGTGRIPQGRHLLILSDNGPDNTPWTTDDVIAGGATLTSAQPIFTQVDAIAGRNLPAAVLEIR